MNYKKIYDAIILNGLTTVHSEYTERHHIIPRCLGGTNHKSNLVRLTYRQHFLCHWLLCKMYPDNYKLKAAFGKMLEITSSKQRIISSKHYNIVKTHLKNIRYPWLKEYMNEHGPWNKGKTGLQIPWNKGLKVGPNSHESNVRRSVSMKLRYQTVTHPRKDLAPWNKGKTGLQTAWNKNVPSEKSPCIHCGMMVSKTNMVRWHDDKCKLKP